MFKQGDQVECIEPHSNGVLVKGKIYEVSRGSKTNDPDNMVWIKGIVQGFYQRRFKLHVATETPAPKASVCTCDIIKLMAYGCKCGQIERERNENPTAL